MSSWLAVLKIQLCPHLEAKGGGGQWGWRLDQRLEG